MISNTPVTTKTWKLCAVVTSFHEQCFAYAFDPQDGTPGFGWGVDNDQRGAEKSVARGKMQKRGRISQGRDMRRNDIAEDEDAVGAE